LKQVLQNLSNGETALVEVPFPKPSSGTLLISSSNSLISSGTERMLLDFGKANLLEKARQQPDKVKMVLDKVKTDGIVATMDSVRSKLDQPIPLGYCNAGIVIESEVNEFNIGDRVVSNGSHAEIVRVSKNLCARIPDEVDDESASFTVLASIGLQAIRLSQPTLGEKFVVFGLGLIGLLTVQMLRANGCSVLGIDHDSNRCKIAKQFNAEVVDLSKGNNPVNNAKRFSNGYGVDGVIIAASSKSDEIIRQSANMCRKRGRIVLVGVVGMDLKRDDFYEKEISFQVSSSYGPGRYDPSYEDKGIDYPIGFVRWTEKRNFEAVIDMMANGSINVKPLISSRHIIDNVIEAYSQINNTSTLGVILQYPKNTSYSEKDFKVSLQKSTKQFSSSSPVVGFIGAGNYASRFLIPNFKKSGANLDTIVSSQGLTSVHHGSKAGFDTASTNYKEALKNKNINTIVIATRHHLHASQVINAISSNKNVFVEKPLALTKNDIELIDKEYQKNIDNRSNHIRLMVGFNRRFAPHILKMKALMEDRSEAKIIIMTVNSGYIPANHWTQDHVEGGGRIIGEVCHFLDLMIFLVGHSIKSHNSNMIGSVSGEEVFDDKVSINLSFDDGSIGTIHYLSNGSKKFPKERIEVFCGGSVLQMNNYQSLKGFDWPGFKKMKLLKQNKGQLACVESFVDSIQNGGPCPIPYEEILESSKVIIEIAESLK
jgi:predicted dehydrogenase/threonine dehydrogenase-like Zn-dependent dehydrogenase